MIFWEVLLDQTEEIFTDICGNIFAEWRIEPCNISFPPTSPSDYLTLSWLDISQLLHVTAFVKCLFVVLGCFVEYLLVRR